MVTNGAVSPRRNLPPRTSVVCESASSNVTGSFDRAKPAGAYFTPLISPRRSDQSATATWTHGYRNRALFMMNTIHIDRHPARQTGLVGSRSSQQQNKLMSAADSRSLWSGWYCAQSDGTFGRGFGRGFVFLAFRDENAGSRIRSRAQEFLASLAGRLGALMTKRRIAWIATSCHFSEDARGRAAGGKSAGCGRWAMWTPHCGTVAMPEKIFTAQHHSADWTAGGRDWGVSEVSIPALLGADRASLARWACICGFALVGSRPQGVGERSRASVAPKGSVGR